MANQPQSAAESKINLLLESLGHFGVDLSLDRMHRLLGAMGNPQRRVPIIHVAGSNGKGSVCAYLASVLTQAGYRVGRYTSPHLVSWRERIEVNGTSITATDLLQRLEGVMAVINSSQLSPTQFEVFTAAAWQYFADIGVDVAVMEVGLGGRLDATNVVADPLVTVITSLSREHWQQLGPTLGDIAQEKAGILKAGCPAVIGPLPSEAEAVVKRRLQDLGCPVWWPSPAVRQEDGTVCFTLDDYQITHPLPLLGDHQLVNAALAIATLQRLRQQGWQITDGAIQQGMALTQWPGRLQWVNWLDAADQAHPLLVDGAHNPAAALELRRYVDQWWAQRGEPAGPPQWLIGMLATKDHEDILTALLRPGDSLYPVPVAGNQSADPFALVAIGRKLCPQLHHCRAYKDLAAGLAAIIEEPGPIKILCGSLYLIGDFLASQRPLPISTYETPRE
ncbi:MAG: folylpolyglutamate synthase/dihydrofolate synthase family protein [Cyanobacteriota bacterium]|nr:folylpolyglutamate synthase/dihydrofolate synthase family protein [Cyanobacteriota bacterium]